MSAVVNFSIVLFLCIYIFVKKMTYCCMSPSVGTVITSVFFRRCNETFIFIYIPYMDIVMDIGRTA